MLFELDSAVSGDQTQNCILIRLSVVIRHVAMFHTLRSVDDKKSSVCLQMLPLFHSIVQFYSANRLFAEKCGNFYNMSAIPEQKCKI